MGIISLTNNRERIINKNVSRESGIELLRIVLMFMIVSFHLFSFYIQQTFYQNQSLYITKLAFTNLCVMGVDCFIFISGYYGMKFKIKQLVSLVVQALFYSYACLIFFSIFSDIEIPPNELVKYFLPISSSMWWFLSAYILLYFMSPFLNAGIKNFSKRQFQLLLIGFLYLNCFSNFIYNMEFGGHILNFIFIYLLARYIYIYGIKIKHSFILFVSTVLTMFLLNYFAGLYLEKPILFISRYASVLTIFSAVCLFFTFKKIKLNSILIFKVAPLCFGVYLLHFNFFTWYGVINPILFKIGFLYEHDQFKFIIANIILALIVFTVCLFVEKIRQILCNPILKVINKKLAKLAKLNFNL